MKNKSILLVLVLSALLAGWWALRPRPPQADYKKDEPVYLPPLWTDKVTHAPVRLQIGNHHYEAEREYVMRQPFKGGHFDLVVAWPSMVSFIEACIIAKKTHDKNFRWVADTIEITFSPVGSSGFSEAYKVYYEDRHSWASDGGNWPIVKMDDLGLYKMTSRRDEHYWPIDPTIRTPFQGNPFMFHCSIGSESNTHLTCYASYQLNHEVGVAMTFTKIHLKDWKPMFYRVQEFIKSIEKEQP